MKNKKGYEITDMIVGETVEKKASVKNGVLRMVFAVLSIFFFILVVLSLVRFAGKKASWIYNIIRLVSVVLVLGIYGSQKAGAIRMTWIIIIMLEPIFGTTLYLLIGLNGHTMAMRRCFAQIDKRIFPLLPKNMEVEQHVKECDARLYGVVRYIKNHAKYPVYENTSLIYYDDAEKGFEAQKKDLAGAKHFIFMEYHAIEDAECWHEMLEILEDRVRAGVEVRVFYDDMGSLGFINTDFVKRTEAKGIKCRVFNPFAPGLNLFLNNRDHRKITVIDGRIGFTGGYNLANEYFHRCEPFGFWKDTGLRLEGEAVDSLTLTFLEMWNAMGETEKTRKDYLKYFSEKNRLAYLERSQKRAQKKKNRAKAAGAGDTAPEKTSGAKAAGAGDTAPEKTKRAQPVRGFVQPYADSPMDNVQVGEDIYMSIAEGAKDYVWYMTPYLIITDEMNHVLSLAAMRGVDVRIITPGIPDKKIVYSMTRSFYNGLTRNGVRIYEYTPGFCHAKMCVSDDLVATCGTVNLDYRSLYHHFENGCLYADCDAVMDTKRDFETVFKQSREVTEFYNTGRGALRPVSQMILRLFAPLV